MDSERFVARLKSYFGPWRGDGRDGGVYAEQVIRRWLDKERIPPHMLDDVYLDLLETHQVQPVNTIGIADIAKLIDRRNVPANAPQLISPEDAENVMPREEAARRMRGLFDEITAKARMRRTG